MFIKIFADFLRYHIPQLRNPNQQIATTMNAYIRELNTIFPEVNRYKSGKSPKDSVYGHKFNSETKKYATKKSCALLYLLSGCKRSHLLFQKLLTKELPYNEFKRVKQTLGKNTNLILPIFYYQLIQQLGHEKFAQDAYFDIKGKQPYNPNDNLYLIAEEGLLPTFEQMTEKYKNLILRQISNTSYINSEDKIFNLVDCALKSLSQKEEIKNLKTSI